MDSSHIPATRDLVLIGGGHAHALVLRMWGMRPMAGVRLTLIDPRPMAPYTGMLPGFVAGLYARDEIEIDLVRLARFAGARIVIGAAEHIDPVARIIQVGDRRIGYDVASVDVGITGDLPDVPGFAEHGVPAKPFARFSAGWEAFQNRVDQGERACAAVIGAGLGGVELALAMRGRLGPDAQLSVIGSSGVSGIGPALKHRLLSELRAKGIALHQGRVVQVEAKAVTLEGGQKIPTGVVVGAAGATPQGWIAGSGLPVQDGFLRVGPYLQVEGHETLFAVGDCAHLTHAPRPKAGVFAVRSAPVLFHNLRAALSGGGMKRFAPQRRFLRLVALGDGRAVADRYHAQPWAPAGRAIWAWKDRIDRRFMARLQDLPQMPLPRPPTGAKAQGVSDILDQAPLCAGCGAKVGGGLLAGVLADQPGVQRDDVVTGPGDDAGVLQIGGRYQVLSTDHLRGFSEDAGLVARVAAEHALGDVRAMGAEPQSALAQIILPRGSDRIQARVMAEIMAEVGEVFAQNGAAVLGGHTTMGAELTIGFTVTGMRDVPPIGLGGARAGDALILTGAIGSGVLLAGEMQRLARGRDIAALWSAMSSGQNGRVAAPILAQAHAMTDVTGFGLAGHMMAICRASGVGAEMQLDQVSVFDGALDLAAAGVVSTLYPANVDNAPVFSALIDPDTPRMRLLHDPQTAGGLLAAISAGRANEVLSALQKAGVQAAIIGRVTDGPVGITVV